MRISNKTDLPAALLRQAMRFVGVNRHRSGGTIRFIDEGSKVWPAYMAHPPEGVWWDGARGGCPVLVVPVPTSGERVEAVIRQLCRCFREPEEATLAAWRRRAVTPVPTVAPELSDEVVDEVLKHLRPKPPSEPRRDGIT